MKNFLLVTAVTIFSIPVFSQNQDYEKILTPQNVSVNKTIPKNTLQGNEATSISFSEQPTDEEIFKVHFFEDPLVPINYEINKVENLDLVFALAGFSQRQNPDDFSMLDKFMTDYPDSRWSASLLANLGVLYRKTGYYQKAIDSWQKAWDIMKPITEPRIKVIADKVISEILMINAWVGRMSEIEKLFNEIDHRVIEGPANERIISMRDAYYIMKSRPEVSFKCGPYALNRLFINSDSTKSYSEYLMTMRSTDRGFNLNEVLKMSNDIGLNYQMAYRKPGSAVIVNAVVHWKLNHYSALISFDNGQYKCEDATMGTLYGLQFWLTAAALDSSASGYFLVPQGPLPKGWRSVSSTEASKIYGKGGQVPDKGKHLGDDDEQAPKQCSKTPMAQSNVHAVSVSLHIYDRPLYYTPPVGPAIFWDVSYHQRDSYQAPVFNYSNMGPKWTFGWLSYVKDNPTNQAANVEIYLMDGGTRSFINYNSTTKSYAPELQTKDILTRISDGCYELKHADGSKEVYSRPDGGTSAGRRVFLTKKVDRSGNAVTILYDNITLKVTAIQDAIGQVTTLSYENSADIYKVTKVTDPFGRSASFEYDATGKLTKITDMIGIISSFQYDVSDFITQMTTPYGVTKYIKTEGADNVRSLETQYPLGEREKVEYRESAPGIASSEPVVPSGMSPVPYNGYLIYRNTFFWDKKAMKEAPGVYTAAKIYHWLHGNSAVTDENGVASPILESTKMPLENRVWYTYLGQSSSYYAYQNMTAKPTNVGRVLDDGKTKLYKFSYNSIGLDTVITDPQGRKTIHIYDTNNIDLLEVAQVTKLGKEALAKYTYNIQHLPITYKDAAGLTTYFSYNTAGQIKTVTNPKNETTTFNYDINGYLKEIIGAVAGAKVSFTYDGFGRIRNITDPEGYVIKTDYDALDRPTLITYPNNTFEQIVYNRLDAVHMRDRLGRWSHAFYDSLDRQEAIQDALGRITHFIWCSCGSLSEIIDPLHHVTSFIRDLQGRVTTKVYHDGKSIQYKYEATTSRLKEVTDSKGQKTVYTYGNDENLLKVEYPGALIATPTVSYTYDSSFNRIKTMIDGTGVTAYAYYPVLGGGLGAGKLSSVDGPLNNDIINYSYDSLGRTNNRSINSVNQSYLFDALGRTTSVSNSLGSFAYTYINQTERLSSILMPGGQNTTFSYFDNTGDQRLKQIWNKNNSGTTISKFDYEYNIEGQITKWTQQAGTAAPKFYELGYDPTDQLTSATQKSQTDGTILKRYSYQYDSSGNRLSEQIDNRVTAASYNAVNQMMQQSSGGPMRFLGSVDEFSSVKVKNTTTNDSVSVIVDSTNNFEAFVKVRSGTNNIAISATDYSGNNNTVTNPYAVQVTNGTNNITSFDANGNRISSSNPAITYGWDGADRLISITQGADITEFIYDGLGRRVAEKLNSIFTKRWVWDGDELVEERDATGGTVTKRFFAQGEQLNGLNYYFQRDHLGSLRELTNINGVVQVRYDYDPYGRRTKVSGSIDADFGFTGHYYHSSSGLYLALYREYDPASGSWLSRDPIREKDGINLYIYVKGNSINMIDMFGLQSLNNFDYCPAPSGDKNSCKSFYNHPDVSKKISEEFRKNAIKACEAFDNDKYKKVRKSLQQQYWNDIPKNGDKFNYSENKKIHDQAYKDAACKGSAAPEWTWYPIDKMNFYPFIIREGINVFGPCK